MHTTSNLTPSPDSDDAIRVSENLVENERIRAILSPEPADDQPEVGDWLLQESMPIPQWKREMMIADQIMEKRKDEENIARRAKQQKEEEESSNQLRGILSTLGIDTNSCTIVRENGHAYWIAEEAIVSYERRELTNWHDAFIICPTLKDTGYYETLYYTPSDTDKMYKLNLLHKYIQQASKLSLSRAEPKPPEPKKSPIDNDDLGAYAHTGLTYLRDFIAGVDRGEMIDNAMYFILFSAAKLSMEGYSSTFSPDDMVNFPF